MLCAVVALLSSPSAMEHVTRCVTLWCSWEFLVGCDPDLFRFAHGIELLFI